MNIRQVLFNPFLRYAGTTALIAGLITIFITALIAFYGQLHLDGVVDLHLGHPLTLPIAIAEGIVNWLCMVILIQIAAMIFAPGSFRFIDILGTQALARFPMLVSCIANVVFANEKMIRYIEYVALHQGDPVIISTWDSIGFGILTLITILTLIWTIYLMYKAYSVSANIKDTKGVISFTVALILAEVLSKVILNQII